MNIDDFDPGILLPPLRGRRRADSKERFVTIPMEWAKRAIQVGAFPLAAPIWYKYRITGGQEVVLSNTLVVEFGISRKQKYRLLCRLETAGLVRVQRQGRKSPRVVPVNVRGKSVSHGGTTRVANPAM